ncbi:hypothetical protein VTK26DRAFT_6384 [Humicola hyalothermophila]
MLPIFPLLSWLAPSAAAPLIAPRQAASQVVQLNSIENLAIRSNGHILATNMNTATLYTIDPVAKTSSTAVTVTGATPGLSGIAEYAPDVFAVIGGKGVYKVDFSSSSSSSSSSPDTPPSISLIAAIAKASNLNGLSAFDNSSVLVADAGRGEIYRLDAATGAHDVVLADPTMRPTGLIPFGVDGIRYSAAEGALYYTNIFANAFYRVPVDAATARAAGPAQPLWTGLMGDDLCIHAASGRVYVATNGGNSLVEYDPRRDGAPVGGSPRAVATVAGSTSCAFGRAEGDEDTVYVGGAQGVFAATVPAA